MTATTRYNCGMIATALERMDVPSATIKGRYDILCDVGDKLIVVGFNDHNWDLKVRKINADGTHSKAFDCASREIYRARNI